MNYFVHPTAVVDLPTNIGEGTKIWHFSHIMRGAALGEDCNIGQNVFIASGVQLGRNCKVQNNVSLYEGLICEEEVFLGPSCVFTNIRNPRSAVVRKGQYVPTLVRRGVTIGANATIVCGVELGEYAFVGAGAVVTRSVAPYALVVGTPASPIGWMSRFGHRLHFNEEGTARCPESGGLYSLVDGAVRFVDET